MGGLIVVMHANNVVLLIVQDGRLMDIVVVLFDKSDGYLSTYGWVEARQIDLERLFYKYTNES